MAEIWDSLDRWNDRELEIFTDSLPASAQDDDFVQFLYHEALFDMDISPEYRSEIYEMLVDYLADEYGIDFGDAMDWEAYREWYG